MSTPSMIRAAVASTLLLVPGLQAQSGTEGEEDIFELSPFSVEAGQQSGYRATNTISATRINIPLEEVPMNIPILTEDFIEDVAAFGQREALRWSPAVNDKAVRGFNTDEFLRRGFLHLSDMSQNTISRMEIIRGPSAVLQGTTSPGGAINIIPKGAISGNDFGEYMVQYGGGPKSHFGTMLDMNFGNLGPKREAGHLAAMRFVLSYENSDPYTRYGRREISSVMPSVRLTPFEGTSIFVEYYGYDLESDRIDRLWGKDLLITRDADGNGKVSNEERFEYGEVPIAAAFPSVPIEANFNGPGAHVPESVDNYFVSIEQKLGDNLLFEVSGDLHKRELHFIPGTMILSAVVDPSLPDTMETRLDFDSYIVRRRAFKQVSDDEIEQYRASVLYTAEWGESRHRFVFGHQAADQTRDRERWDAFRVDDPSQPFQQYYDPKGWATDDHTFFNQDEWFWKEQVKDINNTTRDSTFFNHQGKWLRDRLITMWGVYRTDIQTFNRRDSAPFQSGEAGFVTRLDEGASKTLPQFGALYQLNETWSGFLNYSQSTLPQLGSTDGFGNPFSPGEATITEVGVKFDAADSKLVGTASLYTIADEGRIVFDPDAPNEDSISSPNDPNLRGANVQVGEVESEGFDIDIFYYPVPDWSIVFGYAYNSAEISADPDETIVGRQQNGTFKHKATLWNKYTFSEGALKGAFVGGGFQWRGERLIQYRDGTPAFHNPYVRLDLMFGWEATLWDVPVEIAVNIQNLLQEDNTSNGLPRRDLMEGWQPGTHEPYEFEGEIEYFLTARFKL